ncbi:cellulase [Candidatus Termititenax persephonae]|uniref:Cellulase n=1 Tax=Candidatus Termititenax persephonae TaxID=2218525 RepID=A0A388TF44_9BACT|nr:cellulase [Candidatus Termititenax persephonae]
MGINIDNAAFYQRELRRADADFSGEIDSEQEIKQALQLILEGRPIDELPQKYQRTLRQFVDTQSREDTAFNDIIDTPEVEAAVAELMKHFQTKEDLLKELVYSAQAPIVSEPNPEPDAAHNAVRPITEPVRGLAENEKVLKINVAHIEPLWDKNRLQGRRVPGGFEIYDPRLNSSFADCEMFAVVVNKTIDYGEKTLRLTLQVGQDFRALWGQKIFQVTLNGIELKPGNFELDFGSDLKGFVPPQDGVYEFIVPKEMQNIGVLAFMTAGATNYFARVSNIEIVVQPEPAPQVNDQTIQSNQIGYIRGFAKTAIVELPADSAVDSLEFSVQNTQGEAVWTGRSTYNQVYKDAGAKVMVLDFSALEQPGTYTLIVPQQNGISGELKTPVVLKENPAAGLSATRNAALLAFKWFTDGEHGPYGNIHEQDKETPIYGSETTIDVSGGWHDAGDYGKYTVNGAYSAGLLLVNKKYADNDLAYDAGLVPRENAARADYLSIVKHELDFLLKMQRTDGACYHKATAAEWLASEVAPQDDAQLKTVLPVSTTATADFAAAMALGYAEYKNSAVAEDRIMAAQYLAAAEQAWAFLVQNPDLIMTAETYDNHRYGGPYTDHQDQDERLWAAVELFNATGEAKYQKYIKDNLPALLTQDRFGDNAPDWGNVNYLALFSYTRNSNADPELQQKIESALIKYADALLARQAENPYGLAFAGIGAGFDWGSNSVAATAGLELMYIYKQTGNLKYKQGALKIVDYLLGKNPNGISYITGFGEKSVRQPHFRPSMSGQYPTPDGLLVGGPNSVAYSGDTIAMSIQTYPAMRIYADDQNSWSTNEVAINWQANLAALLALLSEE